MDIISLILGIILIIILITISIGLIKLKEIINNKKVSEECWNLNYYLMEWLNEHLKVYKGEANKVVNLEYYKFNFKGKEYTQLQIIDMLIEKTNYLLDDVDYFTENAKINETKNDIYDLMKLIHWHLWW